MHAPAARRGISPLISVVLYVAIAVASITLVLGFSGPLLERMQGTAAVQQSINSLTRLDQQIRAVAEEGTGSTRLMTLRFRRGTYRFDQDTRQLYYELETTSPIISTHATTSIGPVELSADTGVSTSLSAYRGTPCLRMENSELDVCIREVGGFNASRYDSLVGYWRFNEGNGQWVNGSSQHRFNATRGDSTASEADDPTWTDGVHGDALRFDDTDDHVNLSHKAALQTEPISVVAWINSTDPQQNKDTIVDKGDMSSSLANRKFTYHMRGKTDGAVAWAITSDVDGDVVIEGGNLTAFENEWVSVVGTANGSHLQLYLDGEKVATGSYAGDIVSRSDPLQIGDTGDDSTVFDGEIDAVRIYNRSLRPWQVEWLAQQRDDHRYINTSHLVIDMQHKESGAVLNGTLSTFIAGTPASRAGTGATALDAIGPSEARGRVTANLSGTGSGAFNVTYDLLSGADFLTVGSEADTVTTRLDVALTSRAADDKFIDGQQRGEGVYTGSDIGFGYVVSQNATVFTGLVGSDGFDSVGFDNTSDGGRYRFNLTQSDGSTVLVPLARGSYQDVESHQNRIVDGVFGRDQFFSFPRPSFTGPLNREKQVRAALSYDRLVLDGFTHAVGPGTHRIVVKHAGVVNGKPKVTVRVK